MCGVGIQQFLYVLPRVGLPPRVRGGLATLSFVIIAGGFIPACAGWVVQSGGSADAISVYPRVCGVGAVVSA